MRIFVHHNREGEILSISRVEVMPEGIEQPFIASEGEVILEVPVKTDLVTLDAIQLHEQYRVDVKKKKLVKKT